MLKSKFVIRNWHKLDLKLGRYLLGCVLFFFFLISNSLGQSASIYSAQNGTADNPKPIVEWVRGNLDKQHNHYLEGGSIPYQVILENLGAWIGDGTTHTLTIEFDIKQSGMHTIDYLTAYDYQPNHLAMWGHEMASIYPWDAFWSTEAEADPYHDAFYFNSPPLEACMEVDVDGDGVPEIQPYEIAETTLKRVDGWNVDIIDVRYVPMPYWSETGAFENEAALKQQIEIDFIPLDESAIIAFGGHIACRLCWGYDANGDPLSAGGVSGSSYHMRLQLLDDIKVGSRDMQLSGAAVYVPCAVELTAPDDEICIGEDGEIEATATNGTPPYNFVLLDNGVPVDECSSLNEPGVCTFVLSPVSSTTYTIEVTDAVDCTDNQDATITVHPLPVVNLDDLSMCIDAGPVQLLGTPAGGSYSGPGVSPEGLFDPTSADIGEHTINYCYEDENGCSDCDNAVITVYPLPVVNLDDLSMCIDADPIQLAGTPAGGSYSGPGVSPEGMFDPASADIGEHTINYCYEDENGCRNCDNAVITVYPLPVVILDDLSMCIDADPLQLLGTPEGGSYSGPGVSSEGMFDPASADIGEHTITYCYEDDNGCRNCDDAVITVNPLPVVVLDDLSMCIDADPVQLTGTPTGGSYSGPGVSPEGMFDPASADIGEHTINYCYEDENGCMNCDDAVIFVNPLPLAIASTVSPVCADVLSIQLFEEGGDAISWEWSSNGDASFSDVNSQNPTATGFIDGEEFTVTIVDINGCISSDNTSITIDYLSCEIELISRPIICPEAQPPPGAARVNVTGGIPPFTYLWSNGEEDNPATDINIYQSNWVEVTDAIGCVTRCEIPPSQLPDPFECETQLLSNAFVCPGSPTQGGSASVSPIGGTEPFSYLWDNGETTQIATNLPPGENYVTVLDDNLCVTECMVVIPADECKPGFCFYTQGFYGNQGGLGWTVDCDLLSAMEMMQMVLPDGQSEIFGVDLDLLYFTLFGSDISNYSIFDMLPGGKSAQSLTGVATYSNTGSWMYVPMESNTKKKSYGSINNILLAQAITFYFNLGHNSGSDQFEIGGNRLVTAPSNCSFDEQSTMRDTFNIPQNVIDYLGVNNTLADLLQLAKDVLGADYNPALISPADVTGALDAFNQGFDECRMFVEYFDEQSSKVGKQISESSIGLSGNDSNIKIYPNPFNRNLRFEMESGNSKHLILELYDLKGSKIQTLFDKSVKENQLYSVDFDGSYLMNGTYFFRLISDQNVITGKLIKFRGY